MAAYSILDSRGRLTIRPEFRLLLEGPVEQLETEEGILLRPAPDPPAQEGLGTGTGEPKTQERPRLPTSLSPVEQRS